MLFHKFWIDTKCDDFLNAISQYSQEWDDKRGMFRDQPRHDWTSHYADSLRYLSIVYNKIIQTKREAPKSISYNL